MIIRYFSCERKLSESWQVLRKDNHEETYLRNSVHCLLTRTTVALITFIADNIEKLQTNSDSQKQYETNWIFMGQLLTL